MKFLQESPKKCKCCLHSSNASPYHLGQVDFNKSCADRFGTRIFPISDNFINYYKCQNCGFMWTNAFDEWTEAEYKQYIYNDEYILVDGPIPGSDDEKVFNKELPIERDSRYLTALRHMWFIKENKQINILDYGSGATDSPMKKAFTVAGYQYEDYDKFRNGKEISNIKYQISNIKYDYIMNFEVIEHVSEMEELAHHLNSLLHPYGIIYFGVLLFPKDFNSLNHWYISPRNGHISIHTCESMTLLFRRHGINIINNLFGTIGIINKPWFENILFV